MLADKKTQELAAKLEQEQFTSLRKRFGCVHGLFFWVIYGARALCSVVQLKFADVMQRAV